jgi:hypothetical protein
VGVRILVLWAALAFSPSSAAAATSDGLLAWQVGFS